LELSWPAGHAAQEVSPAAAWYWPAAHVEHVWAPPLLYLPTAQSSQAVAPALLFFPDTQFGQNTWPEIG
jgi:hypothetical protein